MEWIWNYVFALLTAHSITQMDSCRHGRWAKLVTLRPNNIAITKYHTNYGHIGIFIGAWVWQPKQCPVWESGAGSLCLTSHNGNAMVCATPLIHTLCIWSMDPWAPAMAPGPGLCLLSPHNGENQINVRSFSQQSPASDMNQSSLVSSVYQIKWETVGHPVRTSRPANICYWAHHNIYAVNLNSLQQIFYMLHFIPC